MSLEYWVWLSLVLGYKSRCFKPLLQMFHDPKTAYEQRSSDAFLQLCLPVKAMQALQSTTREQAFDIIDTCNALRVKIIPYNSPEYPEPLRQLEEPPIILYAVGKTPDFASKCLVAMVGTRKATEYGCKAAFSLSYRLSKAGCIIISGIAKGIDRASHLGAISAGGQTVAFLPYGHGNKQSYIKQQLLDKILAAGGCLLSEVPPKIQELKNAYHLRNRLISGMASALIVVQAPSRSGALITARYAAEQGKEIFAVTGLSGDESFAGTHTLIRDGATPLFDIEDILQPLSASYTLDTKEALKKTGDLAAAYNNTFIKKQVRGSKQAKNVEVLETKQQENKEKKALPEGLSKSAAAVYQAFSADGDYIDKLVEKTGLGSGCILSAVTELEIAGLIKLVAGGMYILV